MALSDYPPVRRAVQLPGGESFDIRGLALEDVATLIQNHLPDLDSLVNVFVEQSNKSNDERTDIEVENIVRHAVGAVRTAPALVAHTIALACDEPDSVDQARSLPLPVQVQAIREIVDLTFSEAGGPKKFLESLMFLIRGIGNNPV